VSILLKVDKSLTEGFPIPSSTSFVKRVGDQAEGIDYFGNRLFLDIRDKYEEVTI